MKDEESDFGGYRKLIWHGNRRNPTGRRPHEPSDIYETPPGSETEEEQPREKPQKRERRRGPRRQH